MITMNIPHIQPKIILSAFTIFMLIACGDSHTAPKEFDPVVP